MLGSVILIKTRHWPVQVRLASVSPVEQTRRPKTQLSSGKCRPISLGGWSQDKTTRQGRKDSVGCKGVCGEVAVETGKPILALRPRVPNNLSEPGLLGIGIYWDLSL